MSAATTFLQSILAPLSREDCIRRLAAFSVGRLAVGDPGRSPLVVPVGYLLDGNVVVIRTDADDRLATRNEIQASLEVDDFDRFHRSGWSVLVQGLAYETTGPEIAQRIAEPASATGRERTLVLVPHQITGRTIRVPLTHCVGWGYG